MKTNDLSKLEAELQQLETRRADLAAEHDAAVTASNEARAAFIAGKSKPADIASAGAKASSLADALNQLDELIKQKASELAPVRAAAKLEAVKVRLVELAAGANEARTAYEQRFLELDQLLRQHAEILHKASDQWASVQGSFFETARSILPAFSKIQTGLSPAERVSQQRAAEALLDELKVSVDLSGALADAGHIRNDWLRNWSPPDSEFATAIYQALDVISDQHARQITRPPMTTVEIPPRKVASPASTLVR